MIYRDYLELCKPRVIGLMLITAWVGMLLATSNHFPWQAFLFGTIGIGCLASAGAVVNHLLDMHLDQKMRRTHNRPIATGRVSVKQATIFATVLGVGGLYILYFWVNPLTAILTLLSFLGYAFIYTLFLKHATPQNIVIGGIAGAAPPLLGWTAMTNQIDPFGLLLVLIIYIWTPPHFWALAIYRQEDYAKANIPMLPVTHGIAFTKLTILLYIILLNIITFLPFLSYRVGYFYLASITVLNAIFVYYGIKLYLKDDKKIALDTFRYSIIYLFALFISLLIDHYR